MTPEILIALTDQMGAGYAALRGDSEQGYGCGHAYLPLPEDTKGDADYGLSLACRRVTRLIMETHDIGLIASTVVNAPRQFQTVANLGGLCAGTFAYLLTSIGHQCRVGGTVVNGLESYSAYYNVGAGGPWNCLLSPLYAELHALLWPSSPLPASSVLPEGGNLALATSGRSTVITPRSTSHAGYTDIYAVADGAMFSENGNRTLTITGTSMGTNGTLIEGAVWTAELAGDLSAAKIAPASTGGRMVGGYPNDGAAGQVKPTPAPTAAKLVPTYAGSRLVSIASVSLPTGMISGSVRVSAGGGRDYPLIPR